MTRFYGHVLCTTNSIATNSQQIELMWPSSKDVVKVTEVNIHSEQIESRHQSYMNRQQLHNFNQQIEANLNEQNFTKVDEKFTANGKKLSWENKQLMATTAGFTHTLYNIIVD